MKTDVIFKWYQKQVIDKVEAELAKRLDAVGIFLQGEVVKSFGSGSPLPEGGAMNSRGKKISAKRWRQMQHSAKGEPPFVQTGMLRRSIRWQREGLKRLLIGSTLKPQNGSPVSYALALEKGAPTRHLEARPYLRPAVINNKAKIMGMIIRG